MNTQESVRNRGARAIACALLLCGPSVAGAAAIQISFTAEVTGFSGLTEFASDVPVAVGDTVTGTWSYDTDAAFTSPWFDDPVLSFSFDIGNGALIYEYDGTNPAKTVNYGFATSEYLAVADHERSSTLGSITATPFASSHPESITPWVPITGLMWSDDITGSPLPETLTGIGWHLQFDTMVYVPNGDYFTWTGGGIYIDLETVSFSGGGTGSPVPAPGTLLLLAPGLVGLATARGRSRRAA